MRRTSRDQFFLRAILSNAWSAVTARPTGRVTLRPAFFVHDPQADKPKDLDDPFLDPDIQERIGQLLARASAAQKPKSRRPVIFR
jgi:hypothetical protein